MSVKTESNVVPITKTLEEKILELAGSVTVADVEKMARLVDCLLELNTAKMVKEVKEALADRKVISAEDFTKILEDENKARKNPMNWANKYKVSRAEMNEIANPRFLYKNLIISSQIAAIMAQPNGGKTTLMMFIAGEMVKNNCDVYYFNADTSGADAKPMLEYADNHGFLLALPDMKSNMSGVVDDLYKMVNNTDVSLEGKVLIFDTLKKMTDLMSKNASKELYGLLRKLSTRGATCILLGHINKHKDKSGNPVYEGVADLYNDVDAMFYLLPEHHDDGSMLITTKVHKKRGDTVSITFSVDADRNVTQLPVAVDAEARQTMRDRMDKDKKVIEAINTALLDGHVSQLNIIESCNDTHRISRRNVRAVLQRYTSSSATTCSLSGGKLWGVTKVGKFLEHRLLPKP